MIPRLQRSDPPTAFPPVESALTEPDGLLCYGGDLSAARLLEAYRRGIFPWFSAGQPILWWSPDPRTVLYPTEFKLSRSLAKVIRNRGYVVTLDRAFGRVMEHCADPTLRPEGTWISPQMHAAYQGLHELGFAHSFETWDGDRLVGGLYGVSLGGVYFGESMFSLERDASKVALHALVQRMLERGGRLIDCQVASAHLESLGARSIPRRQFVREIADAIPDLRPDPAWGEASIALPQPFMQNSRGPRGR
ncbi:MAG: leucyl/phenylalanyl-tRNA--protein transferase [Steroidobacteraceae bacterium]|nr:leucyl/phenylalanyl-tRNA--protein transferase [Steroidobacteraceae bacterium]